MGSMLVDSRTRMEIEATEETVRFLKGEPLRSAGAGRRVRSAAAGTTAVAPFEYAGKNGMCDGGSGFLGSHVADQLAIVRLCGAHLRRIESRWVGAIRR